MTDADVDVNEELLDYEDPEDETTAAAEGAAENGAAKTEKVKGNYVSIHSSGFRDFLLKPEILRSIVDCGFEHPSEIQHECIPQAVLGMDILSQAKSGMGKTAVFVLATLQQIEPVDGQVSVLVMCHTRELAFQISKEYERFCKFQPNVKVGVFFGGLAIAKDEQVLKTNCPHIVVGTPGRILALVRSKKLNLKHLKHFVLDECDKMLEQLDMRRDVQEIFRATPHEKQVMMFSATLSKEIRPVCKKFMQDVRYSTSNYRSLLADQPFPPYSPSLFIFALEFITAVTHSLITTHLRQLTGHNVSNSRHIKISPSLSDSSLESPSPLLSLPATLYKYGIPLNYIFTATAISTATGL